MPGPRSTKMIAILVRLERSTCPEKFRRTGWIVSPFFEQPSVAHRYTSLEGKLLPQIARVIRGSVKPVPAEDCSASCFCAPSPCNRGTRIAISYHAECGCESPSASFRFLPPAQGTGVNRLRVPVMPRASSLCTSAFHRVIGVAITASTAVRRWVARMRLPDLS